MKKNALITAVLVTMPSLAQAAPIPAYIPSRPPVINPAPIYGGTIYQPTQYNNHYEPVDTYNQQREMERMQSQVREVEARMEEQRIRESAEHSREMMRKQLETKKSHEYKY